MKWYLKVLKNYLQFTGRASRQEYWMFVLFNMIFVMVAVVLDNLFGSTIGELPYGVVYFVYAFAIMLPSIAVSIRRLHDIGKSGFMILVSFIPIAGGIWLLILLCKASEAGSNIYGSAPEE